MRDTDGMAPIHYLCWSFQTTPAELSHALIHEDRACLSLRDSLGRSPLHLSAARGNKELTAHLLRQTGARPRSDLYAKDDSGATLLHRAVASSRTQAIDLVLEASGGDASELLHALDRGGRSVLHAAVIHGNTAAVRRLLEHGAGPLMEPRDTNGKTPAMLAAKLKGVKGEQVGECLREVVHGIAQRREMIAWLKTKAKEMTSMHVVWRVTSRSQDRYESLIEDDCGSPVGAES